MLTIALVACLINVPANGMNPPKVAIIEAARRGNLEKLNQLIKKDKGCVNRSDESGITALMYAATRGNLDCVKALINAGSKVNQADNDSLTALMYAASFNHHACIQALIAAGANASHALRLAIKNNNLPVIKHLLCSGIDVNMPITLRNETALYRAAEKGKTNIVLALLLEQANANQARPDGITPLMIAAQKGHIAIVDMLLRLENDHAVSINAKAAGHQSVSALYLAAQNGKTNVVELLLRNGADLNITADKEVTPLMAAATKGHEKIVRLLLHYGADHTLKTQNGSTAYDLALKNDHNQICELLKSKDNK